MPKDEKGHSKTLDHDVKEGKKEKPKDEAPGSDYVSRKAKPIARKK